VRFFKRLFSSDRRSAIRAEGVGDFELAAARYALAGDSEAVVRMHLERATRARSREQEIDCLRDALHWSREDKDLLAKTQPALARALLSRAKAQGVTTQRDREHVREAAELLECSELYADAGDAFLSIGDREAAAHNYRAGGLVAKLEHALNAEDNESERSRIERSEFANYKMHLAGGDRDQALCSLRACIQAADDSSDYRRRLHVIEAQRITAGTVTLRTQDARTMVFSGAPEIHIGRDNACTLPLHSQGISRRHAIIGVAVDNGHAQFQLVDAGSRNGTRVGGMPLQSSLVMRDSGIFQLGDSLEIHFSIVEDILHLEVRSGVDAGEQLWACSEASELSLSPLDVDALIRFRDGRPYLHRANGAISLNGERIVHGEIQLIHGDRFAIDSREIEVL